MNINDHLMNYILTNKNGKSNEKNENDSSINTIIFNSSQIYSYEIKNIYHIECLSLRNNFIKNISFLLNLPNLYYLDLFGNPIENYKPIIKLGTFGYLSISPPLNYFEKQILSLKSLNIVIFQAEIKDRGIYNNFLMRNPNILVFNNTIIDFGKKIRTFCTMMNFRYYIQNILMDKDELPLLNNSNNNSNKSKNKNNIKGGVSPRKSISIDTLNNRDNFLERRLRIRKKDCLNKKCIEIVEFYEEYNNILFGIFKNNKSNYDQDILCIEEKKKFIMIYNTFNYIGHFFSKNNNYYKYHPKKSNISLDTNEISSTNYPNINIEMFTYLNLLQYKEFVLSIMILYLFSILSKGITYDLILSIFKKTNYYNENNKNKYMIESDLKSLLDIEKSFLFAFYYKIYDILFEVSGRNIDLNKLYEIQERLKLVVIADKINEVLSHQENFIIKYKSNSELCQKNKIISKDFIKFLFDAKIFHKIFNIIQFVNDFIIYNNLLDKLGHDFPDDMQFFTEIQGLILNNFDKNNEMKESMADKNYNKIQISSLLNNKFFFKNENYFRTNQNISSSFFSHRHKTFYPNKKRINNIENLKSSNEIRREKVEMIKKNYINNALNSFFQVINTNNINNNSNSNNNNNNKVYIDNRKLNNFLNSNNLSKRKHKRNISNEDLMINMKKSDIFKTFTIFAHKNNKINEENFNKSDRTIKNLNKLKLFSSSSSIKSRKNNIKNTNKYPKLKSKNLLNNDILSNQFNFSERKTNKKNKNESLNITEKSNRIIVKNSNLMQSYDKNNKMKYVNQFTLTINKKEKKHPCSFRIIKKDKIISSLNDYQIDNMKLKIISNISKDFNPFSLINKHLLK